MPPIDLRFSPSAELTVVTSRIILTLYSLLLLWTIFLSVFFCACCRKKQKSTKATNALAESKSAFKNAPTSAPIGDCKARPSESKPEEPCRNVTIPESDESANKSTESGSKSNIRKQGKERKRWSEWRTKLPWESHRRPIMPVTEDKMIDPANQKYMKSWSILSKTESTVTITASGDSGDTKSYPSPKGKNWRRQRSR